MKINKNFVLTELSDTYIAVPVGDDAQEMQAVVRLNKTGKTIWEALTEGADESTVVRIIKERYDIDETTASADVHAVIERLREAGIVED